MQPRRKNLRTAISTRQPANRSLPPLKRMPAKPTMDTDYLVSIASKAVQKGRYYGMSIPFTCTRMRVSTSGSNAS